MVEIVFRVQGSQLEPYRVSFSKEGDNLTAHCTCRAGIVGRYCKHRLNILLGDTSGIVVGDLADVATVVSWFPGSDVEAAIMEMAKAEQAGAGKEEMNDLRRSLSHKLMN